MLTYERLTEVLDYDPDIGVFTWKKSTTNCVRAGAVAGAVSGGYRRIKIDCRLYAAHRLAWLYQTRSWPPDMIDHIDGNKLNNRFRNLREATRSENNSNSKRPANNSSGFKGVSYRKQVGRWTAQITVNNKRSHIGYFNTPEAAHAAYVRAAKQSRGEFARFE